MKESEKLKLKAQQEDNDFRALNLGKQAIREARFERFEELDIQKQLENKNCIVTSFNGTKITIDTQIEKFGIVDYFPKANRVLIRKTNEWKNAGLKWIITNLLK